ncbi:MAG: hypothetical protein JWN02_247 [Acidobacteria bacterium]|nr:hypothetical protein [Acidobacteriota bacterium]
MIRTPLSTTAVLDDTSEVIGLAAAPWAAVLIATSLPYRFLQIAFLERLIELAGSANHYGRALQTLAYQALAAFVVSLVGRALFARACRLAASTGRTPGAEVFRIRPAALADYLFTGLLGEALFFLAAATIIGFPLAVLFSGLAVGTFETNERPGIAGPLRNIARYSRETRTLVGLLLCFTLAFFAALANVMASFSLGLWLSGSTGLFDTPRWQLLLTFGNRHWIFLCLAGALLAIQPFWIAANVLVVRKSGAAESGEELRMWFDELRSRGAA